MVSTKSKNSNTNPLVSKISMFISGICMGNVGLLVTFLSRYSVYTITLLRGIFGTLYLTLFMVIQKSFSKDFLKESFKFHWKLLFIIGIINPIVILLYFISITISGYSIAAFLLYTSGIYLLLLLIITKEEKVSKVNLISFSLAILGVAIIMEFWNGDLIIPGILVGVFSGLALTILVFSKKKIYNKRIQNQHNLKSEGNFDTFLAWWSTIFLILMFLPIGGSELLRLSLIDIILSLILGFFPTALAFTLYNVGVKNDTGGSIVILSYFEPVMATINTAIFLKNLSIFTVVGGGLILLANLIVFKYSR